MKKLLTTASAIALAVGLFASASASAAPLLPAPPFSVDDGYQVQSGGVVSVWFAFSETPAGEFTVDINGPINPFPSTFGGG